MHTHSNTHTQLDICSTEGDVCTPASSEVVCIFQRPSHGAHLAFTLLQAHSATQTGSTDSSACTGTVTGQEVVGTCDTHEHGTQM